MNKMKWLEIMAASAAAIVLGIAAFYAFFLPDSYRAEEEEGLVFASPLFSASPEAESVLAFSGSAGENRVVIRLLGVVPVKTVTLSVEERPKRIPAGEPFGVKLFTREPAIVGLQEVPTAEGNSCPGEEAGLLTGDRIVSVNGKTVSRNEEVALLTQESGGQPLLFTVLRGDETFSTTVTPVYSETSGCYQSGLWVRDSAAGIGTITYWDPETGTFAGLGHGICDLDTGERMSVGSGEICEVFIHQVRKGTSGNPGELSGIFLQEDAVGSMTQNEDSGIYGEWYEPLDPEEALEVAYQQEVVCGDATILCTVEGSEPQEYHARICSIDYNQEHKTQNLVVEITDEALLASTGGIVQGMSGSPILQNGRLVGAVTHV